jgi:hypothetical protein
MVRFQQLPPTIFHHSFHRTTVVDRSGLAIPALESTTTPNSGGYCAAVLFVLMGR